MELDWRDSARRKEGDEDELPGTDPWSIPGGGSE